MWSSKNILMIAGCMLACTGTLAYAQSYADALANVQRGDFAGAVTILQPLAVQSPKDARVLNLLGAALSGAGRREEGSTFFLRALAERPGYLPVVKNLALNELALGLLVKARAHFEEIAQQSPADISAQLGLAQIDFAEKHFGQALQHYEKSGGLYLKDASALLGYATSCVEMKQAAKALDAIQQLPDLDAGLLLARLGRYADAAKRFESARAGAADAYQVEFNLTLAYLKSGNSAAAIGVAKGMRPSSEVSSLLAQGLEASGKTAEAYEVLREASVQNPKDESPYLELLALCAEHENYDLSLKVAQAALHQLPGSHRIYSQRGIVLAMMGRFAEAESDLKKAEELSPDDTMAPVARSLVLMRNDRVNDAVEELRRRRAMDGGDYLVNWFLAEALTRQGKDGEEAFEAVQRSVQLNPDVAQSRALLGKLLLARGDAAAAITQLERALELNANSVTAMYQLAQAYRRRGNAAKASELFAKVAKTKSEDADTLTRDGMMRIVRDGSH